MHDLDLGLEIELCEEAGEVAISSKYGRKTRFNATEIIRYKNENDTLLAKQEEMEDKISNLIQELRCRDGQYKELLNENERLERELKWSEGNLKDKMMQLNKHSNLVDDLMKVINILVNDKSEEDE